MSSEPPQTPGAEAAAHGPPPLAGAALLWLVGAGALYWLAETMAGWPRGTDARLYYAIAGALLLVPPLCVVAALARLAAAARAVGRAIAIALLALACVATGLLILKYGRAAIALFD